MVKLIPKEKRGPGRPKLSEKKVTTKIEESDSEKEENICSKANSIIITNTKPVDTTLLGKNLNKFPIVTEFVLPEEKINQILPKTKNTQKIKNVTKNVEYYCKSCSKKLAQEKDRYKPNVEIDRLVFVNYKIDYIYENNVYSLKIDKELEKKLICAYDSGKLTDIKFPVPRPRKTADGSIVADWLVAGPSNAISFIIDIIKDETVQARISLVYEITAKAIGKKLGSFTINRSPDRRFLECYGGTMNLKQFREACFYTNKVFNVYSYPIKQTNLTFEEKIINPKNRQIEKEID